MIINIVKDHAFIGANLFRADADFQAVFRFIRISPSGRVTGTDGFRASDHKHGAEPFDLEGDVFIRPLGKIPKNAHSFSIELPDEPYSKSGGTFQGQIHYKTGKNIHTAKPGVVLCEATYMHTFPDVDRVIPTVGKAPEGSVFGINAKFLMDVATVIGNNQVWWQTSGTSTPALAINPDDPHHTLLLVPLRVDLRDISLPMREE